MSGEFYLSVETSSDAKVLIISVAARMAGMHPQTLRQYDRLGLVQPGRTPGGGRRYSTRDVNLLREVQRLSQEEGVNLAGIKRVIELEQYAAQLADRVDQLERELAEAHRRLADIAASTLPRRDLVPRAQMQSALVVWRPRRAPEGRAMPEGSATPDGRASGDGR